MERPALLYDAACGFCRCAAAAVAAWDRARRLRIGALQDPEAEHLLAGLPAERRMASWHLVAADGEVRSGGAAVGPLMDLLPAGAPLAALARLMPGLTDATYGWVARRRGSLGRLLGRRCDPVRR